MHKKPVLTPSLVTWTGIFVLCFLVGAGGVRIAQHHAGSWQAMKDTIQSDTPSTADRLATHDYFHETEKIPTQDDSLKVSLTFEVWHVDTVRISGLPAGALVRISYPDLHAFVIDTANDSGEIVYPHPIDPNVTRIATEAFDQTFSSDTGHGLRFDRDGWVIPPFAPLVTYRRLRPYTQHQLDSCQRAWVREFTKYLDTAHLYMSPIKPDSKLLNN